MRSLVRREVVSVRRSETVRRVQLTTCKSPRPVRTRKGPTSRSKSDHLRSEADMSSTMRHGSSNAHARCRSDNVSDRLTTFVVRFTYKVLPFDHEALPRHAIEFLQLTGLKETIQEGNVADSGPQQLNSALVRLGGAFP